MTTKGAVVKNSNYDKLGRDKEFARGDTSYSSIWLYNSKKDINSKHFKSSVNIIDNYINFADKNLFSEFSPTVAKNVISYWSNEGDIILDPFAGRTRSLISYVMGRKYFGYEINFSTWKYNNDMLKKYNVDLNNIKVIPTDSINIEFAKIYSPQFDLLFTCPPYWNLEVYGNEKGQLSNIKEYDIFLKELVNRLNKNISLIKSNKYIIIVVGDFRKKNKFYTLHVDLINMLKNNKEIELYDIIINQNIPFSVGSFRFGKMKNVKKVAKVHEYILVFKKK